jgi:hypothetical protein
MRDNLNLLLINRSMLKESHAYYGIVLYQLFVGCDIAGIKRATGASPVCGRDAPGHDMGELSPA